MALFIVALGSASATSLIVNAMQSNSMSRDNLVALNLAVEGLEAVRNIRDSNWLKFNYNKAACWNEMPSSAICGTAKFGSIVDTGITFSVLFDPVTMKWKLESHAGEMPADITGEISGWRLYYMDMNKNIDSDGDGIANNDRDIINDSTVPTSDKAALRLLGTNFFRAVNIKYTAGTTDPITLDSATEMTVTSLVQWKSGSKTNQVKLSTKLTNYQKVKVS